jgi:CheY-like chemotaxis protein
MTQAQHSILLVDDDKMTNFYNSKIIESMNLNFHIEICEDGAKALDFLRSINSPETSIPVPEVILLDINMPKMNGWEFIEAYDRLPVAVKAKIVIVMLTTSLNSQDREKAAISDVVTDFYVKPLTRQKMEGIMAHLSSDQS